MNCSYYYCECGTVFSSKIEALVYSKKNNKKFIQIREPGGSKNSEKINTVFLSMY